MNSAKDAFELILAVLTILGIIYQISRIEKAIYDAIDAVKDTTNNRLHRLESEIARHQQSSVDRREHEDYLFNAHEEALQHKFDRLYNHQKDIEAYLQKQMDFRVRRYFGDDDPATQVDK